MQREKCRELFNFMGIGGFEDFFPSRVSGGMKKRCALARTLMFNRDVILLDEPLSSLDTLRRYDMYSLLLSLQQKFGKTILMITHDIDEALLLADRLTVVTNMPMKIKHTFSSFPPKPRTFSDSKLAGLKEEVLANLEGTSAL
jgi:NitT/TauT family transport system ATP-binding protein